MSGASPYAMRSKPVQEGKGANENRSQTIGIRPFNNYENKTAEE